MDYKNTTISIAATVGEVALTGVALAYGHYHHNTSSIKVSQGISQANFCTTQSLCVNQDDNTFGALVVVWH